MSSASNPTPELSPLHLLTDHYDPPVKDDARRAVAGLLAAIAGVAAVFAGVAANSDPGWLLACIVFAAVAAGLAVTVELPDISALLERRPKLPNSAQSPALQSPVVVPVPSLIDQAFTVTSQQEHSNTEEVAPTVGLPTPVTLGRWRYTSDGHEASAAMMALDAYMPGAGNHLQLADRPPWVRVATLIPCSQIGPDAQPAQLWRNFVGLLKDQPVTSLVNGLTRPVMGVQWTRLATTSTGTIQAVYTPGEESEAVASARLELPDGTRRYFHDFASAVLVLHFEPPAGSDNAPLPVGPVAWTDHIKRALELPDALNTLLTNRLDLSTSGDPAVTVGFRLDAPHDLTEIIDITGLNVLPGGQHGRQAIGYCIADPDGGVSAGVVVDRMINHVLMYALQAER
jgi:hypothetical protein